MITFSKHTVTQGFKLALVNGTLRCRDQLSGYDLRWPAPDAPAPDGPAHDGRAYAGPASEGPAPGGRSPPGKLPGRLAAVPVAGPADPPVDRRRRTGRRGGRVRLRLDGRPGDPQPGAGGGL